MMEITLSTEHMFMIRSALLSEPDFERCAVLFASQVIREDGSTRLLVREVDLPDDEDYTSRSVVNAELNPAFVARISKKAKNENLSLIFVHSHPGDTFPQFSPVDDIGEQKLADFLAIRAPNRIHAALVISRGGMRARGLGMTTEVRIITLGNRREIMFDPFDAEGVNIEQFDRQIRAFGSEGQRTIEKLTIGVVGIGGTGSVLVEQLMHLGVKRFILVDPDVIDLSNLNRVVGARKSDVGRPKIEVAERNIRNFSPEANIKTIRGDITHERYALSLLNADFLFGCTDSHGSRAVLQQIAYQYLIPCIDMGSTITTDQGEVTGIYGRIQLLSPGCACLTCCNLLDPEQVRRDMMSESERANDPYIVGAHEPAPAVISINSTVVSLAVTMFMATVTSVPSDGRYLLYNGKSSVLKKLHADQQTNCYICSKRGTYGRGGLQRLYARMD
jgi:molybdopterin/thiamine biosynthesis adenylyltransferase